MEHARLSLIVARNEQQRQDAERLRLRVYAAEEGLLRDPSGTPDRRDVADATTVFLVYAGERAVGSVRLSVAPAAVARGSEAPHGFELEAKFSLSGFEHPWLKLAEISRYCVLKEYRGTRVTGALFAALRSESERLGVTHWVAAANMETDSAEDAAIAYRVMQHQRLLSPIFRAYARRAAQSPARPGRFAYTPEQRLGARRGELSTLGLPRTLTLFHAKMGARYLGEPVYDSTFNVFSAPLAVDVTRLGQRRAATRALASLQNPPSDVAPCP